MKKLFCLLTALLWTTQSIAAEHAGSGVTPNLEAGWSGSSFAALSASNVWAKRAYKADAGIIKGHRYKGILTIGGYSGTGSAVIYTTGVKSTPPAGSWVNADTVGVGLTAVPDNFDYSAGIIAYPTDPQEAGANGSFRFTAREAYHGKFDPVVLPGQPGVSHGHLFDCNTGGNANSTYRSLRTSGGTTCGDPKHPGNRSLYWKPDIVDGYGHIINPFWNLFYYKGISRNYAECGMPTSDSDPLHVGICVTIPNGLAYVKGCNMGTMAGCGDGTGEGAGMVFECRLGSDGSVIKPSTIVGGNGGVYHSIKAVRDAGCTVGDALYESLEGFQCWDGTHVDSPDHRSHMHDVVRQVEIKNAADDAILPNAHLGGNFWGGCPVSHPYIVPSFSRQAMYKIDANFARWHLTSDENMGMAVDDGATLHMDYLEGWSPTAKAAWQTHCLDERNSGNNGSLCDGTALAGFSSTNKSINFSPVLDEARIGWSANFRGNGTYTVELTAGASGELGLYGIGGFTATSVSLSLIDVTAASSAGPTTTHHTN